MSARWTTEEEGKLLKLIASGKTCKELAGGFNRSENALELRLKKIIYDNINNNKPVEKISELLHINKDIIMQHYYSYKDYIEKQQKGGSNNDNLNMNISSTRMNSDSKINRLNNMLNNNMQNNNIQNNNINQINQKNNMSGGNNISHSGDRVHRLEEQNRKMKLILENYLLKHKITKLLKNKNNGLYKDAINALIE
jgi:hypothetical protein